MVDMSTVAVSDRKATRDEVVAHAGDIRRLATELDLGEPMLREDGAVVVRSPESGYRLVTRLSAAASVLVGAYVHVITDDAPAAVGLREL